MSIIAEFELSEIKRLSRSDPPFGVGDTLAVSVNIVEGKKRRTQVFEGVVIAKRNRGLNSSFMLRKISAGEGVERTFQTHSPIISQIKIVRHADVNRAKLYYLRDRSGRSSRIKERLGKKKGVKAS